MICIPLPNVEVVIEVRLYVTLLVKMLVTVERTRYVEMIFCCLQALSVKTVATIRDLDAQQASEFAAFETKLGAEQTSIVQLDDQRKNWKQRAVSGLEYCVSAVDQFLTEELQKDIPTGK